MQELFTSAIEAIAGTSSDGNKTLKYLESNHLDVKLVQNTTKAWISQNGPVVTQNRKIRLPSPTTFNKVKIGASIPHFQPPALHQGFLTKPNRNRARIGGVRYGACR